MRKQKILVTGINGFVGSRFKDLAGGQFQQTGFKHRGKKSITDREYTLKFVKDSGADIVLHLAAKTHIDRCEKDRSLGKKGDSWKINVLGTQNIAEACEIYKKHLLFMSSECVFDGKNSWYKETDMPNPINWYGKTKLEAEKKVRDSGCRYSILRSTLAFGHPGNYSTDLFKYFADNLKSGKKVSAVNDQFLSLTFIDDLITAISVVLKNKPVGIYHYAGNRCISPFEFALIIARKLHTEKNLEPVTLQEYFGSRSVLRLKNAMLSSAKICSEFKLSGSDIDLGIKKAFSGL